MTHIDPAIGIDAARALFHDELAQAGSDAALQALRTRWVGRKGSWVAAFMDAVGKAAPAEKRALGQGANTLKREVEAALETRLAALTATRRPAGAVDVTLPGRRPRLGHRHPLSLVRDQVMEVFSRLGYQVLEGPEIEDDYHNFEALNMPEEHPARDMQDTLYLATPLAFALAEAPAFASAAPDEPSAEASARAKAGASARPPQPLTLLRTHTSAMQIRHMERHDPPVRLVAIGPVYRRDNLDLTHTPMFHQVEGLVVGRGITLADLKGTLTSMAAALFGAQQEVRFRPSFFPYTEPSAEVDIRCIRCDGAGCAICKQTGWLEILGSGMVHPAVFEACGYDPAEVTGFAFGMGIERVALLKWNVDDIRLFYENDLRFLEQFPL
ncbi:MAG: phenylalanine--tRNA ligase subunit alpha [Vicinamibacterales bacterium]|nr:phenylalanine--tRNA ligase subunit alpha [Vicinamibacterales bacterium]